MSTRYPVFIDGKRYSSEFQTEQQYHKGWQSVLAKVYSAGTAADMIRCGCPSKNDRALYISLRDGRYHLARWPGQGGNHAIDCRFYSTVPEHSGLQCYEAGVIKESNGLLSIRLAHGLRDRTGQSPAEQLKRILGGVGGRSQSAMTLLGLLHLLWQEAGINIWHPNMQGKRHHGTVAGRLQRAGGRIGSSRIRLSDVMVVPADKDSRNARANEAVVEAAFKQGTRVLLVGALARHAGPHVTAFPESPMFSKPFGYPKLYVEEYLRKGFERSYGREIKAWAEGHRVVFIAHCEVVQAVKSGRLYVKALAGALMQVSPQWIPVDSDYELAVEERLRQEGRFFEKPMRFDSNNDVIFPDFWLLDRKERAPMEVFGMHTEAYLERRKAKETYYQQNNPGNWWSWVPLDQEEIPPFLSVENGD